MHQCALLWNHSTCFGCTSHPSSGVHKTVTSASGTGHSIWETTFLQCGLKVTLKEVLAQILWPVPEVAVTVLCTPDDGCDVHQKHVEWFRSNAHWCILYLINIDLWVFTSFMTLTTVINHGLKQWVLKIFEPSTNVYLLKYRRRAYCNFCVCF